MELANAYPLRLLFLRV